MLIIDQAEYLSNPNLKCQAQIRILMTNDETEWLLKEEWLF
jgi:hypothetical protein